MSRTRVALAVAMCAAVVYLGALWNRFAGDDLFIIQRNPLVTGPGSLWGIFGSPYWPTVFFPGKMYRPLPVLSYALDWRLGAPAWFHAVNLLWHAAASAAVATLAHRLAGARPAVIAGVLFAVHPVHVEAVAQVVGRAELMGAVFACVAVTAALTGGRAAWSVAAFGLALLCKENAAVVPVLVLWGWLVGIGRPDRRRFAVLLGGWLVVGAAYAAARYAVLAPFERFQDVAPVFLGLEPLAVRLTAVSAFADFARLLLLPLTLRADYSPLERTAVLAPGDPRFLAGLAIAIAGVALLALAWRRGGRVEALGLGWVAIAWLPVSNLVVPIGVLVAERTLYLPSAGLTIAAGVALARVRHTTVLVAATAVLALAGAARTVTRVPVWRSDLRLAQAILEDSPRSYWGLRYYGGIMLSARQPDRALVAYEEAIRRYDRDAALFVAAADAAFTLAKPALGDSLLARAEQWCSSCDQLYRLQAAAARARGDSAVAAALLARAP